MLVHMLKLITIVLKFVNWLKEGLTDGDFNYFILVTIIIGIWQSIQNLLPKPTQVIADFEIPVEHLSTVSFGPLTGSCSV